MSKTSARILFFGNERLATGVSTQTPLLRGLIKAGYDVAAVVIAQNEAGRSRKQRQLEVVELAAAHDIPVIAPAKLSEAASQLADYNAQAAALAAYGKIVPQAIIDLFPRGIINLHPSLLPLHRGPTPLESVILNGDAETGVSVMQLAAKMDAGPVFAQTRLALSGDESKQALADQLGALGGQLLIEKLPAILDGSLQASPQDDSLATYDKLINKTDGQLDFTKAAQQLSREIRAFAGWPRSRTQLGKIDVIITAAHDVPAGPSGARPGTIETANDSVLMIHCSSGYLCVDRLIPAGKAEMTAAAFLAGYGQNLS